MTTPAQLRDQALALPEVQEGTHFRLPAYRVGDAVFLVLQSDEYAVLHVDADTAATAANAFASIEETYRGRTLIGIRAHLPELSPDDLRPILTAAWRHRASRALLARHPQ
jgi:hypothetical protein